MPPSQKYKNRLAPAYLERVGEPVLNGDRLDEIAILGNDAIRLI